MLESSHSFSRAYAMCVLSWVLETLVSVTGLVSAIVEYTGLKE